MSSSELEDWWQLHRLMTRYVDACDERDWDTYQTLFTPNATIDYTEGYGPIGSVEEIVPWLRRVMDPSVIESTQHMLANMQTEVTGNHAKGKVHCFNPDVVIERGERRALLNGGVYTFGATRDSGSWLLTSLKIKMLWSTRAELCTYDPPS